jgi:hypothetical protein
MNRDKATRSRSALLVTFAVTGLLALAGCHDIATFPNTDNGDLLTVEWAATARGLIATHRPSVPAAARQLAYLGLAQYVAVEAVEGQAPRPPAAVDGAVAGASAALLTHFFPTAGSDLDALVRGQAPSAPGAARHFASGAALGRQAAQQVIARAETDRFNLQFGGTIPVGQGYWFSSANPPAPPLPADTGTRSAPGSWPRAGWTSGRPRARSCCSTGP